MYVIDSLVDGYLQVWVCMGDSREPQSPPRSSGGCLKNFTRSRSGGNENKKVMIFVYRNLGERSFLPRIWGLGWGGSLSKGKSLGWEISSISKPLQRRESVVGGRISVLSLYQILS